MCVTVVPIYKCVPRFTAFRHTIYAPTHCCLPTYVHAELQSQVITVPIYFKRCVYTGSKISEHYNTLCNWSERSSSVLMTAPWAVLVHELIFPPQVLQPLPSHGLQWQQHFISRQLRARFYRCTRTRTKVSSKQLLRFKSTLIPSVSLTRVGTLEQGSACCGREPCARTSLLRRPVVETVYRKGKCSVGSLRYQWKRILRATAGSRGAFLYLPLLIPSARERRCQRNTHQEYFQERMAKTITILSQKQTFKSRQ